MNENIEKYNEIFRNTFNVNDSELESLEYNQTPEWKSMAHIALIAALEEAFDVNFEPEDIFGFESYTHGKEILADNYGIEF